VLIGALAAALALGACGRKGPLDSPSAAALGHNAPAAAPATVPEVEAEIADQFNPDPGYISSRRQPPRRGQTAPPLRQSFPLDPLLD
jgi:predicted small lipoprotein YifL